MKENSNGVTKKVQSLYFNTEGLDFFCQQVHNVINPDFFYIIPSTEINELSLKLVSITRRCVIHL